MDQPAASLAFRASFSTSQRVPLMSLSTTFSEVGETWSM